jgi:hypothetical protein
MLAGPLTSESDEWLLRDVLTRSTNPADAFTRIVRDLRMALPLPGSGATARRLAALRAAGRVDLVLARLFESHMDATAIMAELAGGPVRAGELWGVWTGDPKSVTARKQNGAWILNGTKPWCAGADVYTHALVTASAVDGPRLFAVHTSGTSDGRRSLRFEDVHATAVGGPGAYIGRPGFWHGGIGVAACWLGGAHLVARPLFARATSDSPQMLEHIGAVDAALASGDAMLLTAAAQIDAAPSRGAPRLALRVRTVAASVVTDVIAHVRKAIGHLDGAHAENVAMLAGYVRQSQDDLARLGSLVTP